MTTTHTVVQSRILNAAADDVWRAWTEPARMKQWFCPMGMITREVEADLRIGGRFRIEMDASGTTMRPPSEMGDVLTAYGTYHRIERPNLLEFSWAWEGRDETSRVSVKLIDLGQKTKLVLKHDGLMDEASRIFHADGWTPTLQNLSNQFGD